MNKLVKSLFFICFLTLACSSDNFSNSNSNPTIEEPIIPSDLTLQVNIIGQTDSFPNGDGSGLITCSANAIDAINYEFRFGSGVTEQSETGQIEYTYSDQGTNSHTVYVYAYSSTGHYTSTFYTFDLFVEAEAPEASWSEEFNYNGAIDPNVWTHEIGNGEWGWGNNEEQHYTNRAENIKIEDGFLKITARKESYASSEYTSARIKTHKKLDFKYGRVDVRAKMPSKTKGVWPAIWMLGSNINDVGWPACGEIDIQEYAHTNNFTVQSTVHHPDVSPGEGDTHVASGYNDIHDKFYTYSLVWTKEALTFYVDDKPYHVVGNSCSIPFNWNFYIILNVAMGGDMGGTIASDFNFDTMEVDYVRVYQE